MVYNEAARPAGHAVVSTPDLYRPIFYAEETPTFTLTEVSGAIAATTYSVRNYYGTVVRTGSVSGAGTLSLGTPLPLGWYKLYLHRPSPTASPWLSAGGEFLFAVVRSGGSLKPRPALGSTACPWDFRFEGIDYPIRGFAGIGPHRLQVYIDGNWTNSDAAMEANAPAEVSWWNADPTRPLEQNVGFPEGTGGATPTSTDNSRIQQTVASAYDLGVHIFEGRNEPPVNTTAANFYPELQAFHANVKAGNANAQVAGPCHIHIHDGQGSDDGAQWHADLFALGGGNYLDVISFHNYNSGDLSSMRKSFDNWIATLAAYGQHNKPRYNTEFGSRFATVYGSGEPRLQPSLVMMELHIHEQYGIPKERTCYFYDRSHGFWDFPSFFLGDEGEPFPLVPLMRVWSEEVYGKQFSAKLDFGTVDNDMLIGSRFVNPGNGTKTIILQAEGRTATVTMSVTGVSSLTWVDPWGNEAVEPVVNGLATFDVDELPIYLRLPSGGNAVPEIVNYGVEVIRSQDFSVASANTNSSTASRAISGVVGTAWTNRETDTYLYQGVEGTAPPSWWQVDFPASTRVDTVVVMCPEPWQHDSSLLTFEVQTWNGSTWDTQTTVTEDPLTFQWTSHRDAGKSFTDSYWSRRHNWVVRFSPVATTKVRINATSYSYGGGATVDTTNGAGIPGGETGQTSPRHISIKQVQAFLSEGAGGGGAVRGSPMLIQPR